MQGNEVFCFADKYRPLQKFICICRFMSALAFTFLNGSDD
jgi:hypothetical protein